MRPASTIRHSITIIDHGQISRRRDSIATEEPLEIRLVAGAQRRTLAITMRTPGHDFELAAGFLFSEGVISDRREIDQISYCIDPNEEQRYNIVLVRLARTELPALPQLERHVMSSAACGVCGKASLDALQMRGIAPLASNMQVSHALITSLPEKLQQQQGIFHTTGGLHAAALFTTNGDLLAIREDIGRHNAVDKIVGWSLLHGTAPATQSILLVSGRAGFEIVQKCVAAQIPILCAVSAPSSLAIQTAACFHVTLIGFLRGQRFNLYTGEGRIAL
jgi:FdhD protein